MRRLHVEDINSPSHFNWIWKEELHRQGANATNPGAPLHHFDRVRQHEFARFVREGDKVIDVGCGLYGFAEYMAAHIMCPTAELNALDFSEEVKMRLNQRVPLVKFILGDVRSIPFADGTFDFVGSGEVIEHMEDPAAFAAELVRVAKPRGVVLISTVDTECEDAKRHGEYKEHLWEFTPQDLIGFFSPFGSTTYWILGDYHMVCCRKGA